MAGVTPPGGATGSPMDRDSVKAFAERAFADMGFTRFETLNFKSQVISFYAARP